MTHTVAEQEDGSLVITADHQDLDFTYLGDEEGVLQGKEVVLPPQIVESLRFHFEAKKEISDG